MTLAARIIRLENHLHRPGQVEKIDWQPHLRRLSDGQLDRLEQLLIKMHGDESNADERLIGELAEVLDADDRRELMDLGEAMGLEW